MGRNPFYSNAEAYAYEILQQKLMKEAQRTAQQTALELSALRTLFNQGYFIYCIPFGAGLGQNMSFPPCSSFNVCPLDSNFAVPDAYYHTLTSAQPTPPPPQQALQTSQNPPNCSSPVSLPPPQNLQSLCNNNNTNNNNNNNNNNNINSNNGACVGNNKLSVIHMNLKNQSKILEPRSGSDECNLGKEGIEVTIDLREYIPAEIQINVDEKSVEIKACHVSEAGSKTFARRYDLPACIILDSVRCILSHDGFLVLSAAWLKME